MLKKTFQKIRSRSHKSPVTKRVTFDDLADKSMTIPTSVTIGKRVYHNGETTGYICGGESVTPHCLMYYAVQSDDTCLLEKMLTQHKYIDINLLNDDGIAVIHFAAMVGATTSIPVLTRYGADIDLEDIRGNTPLHYAILMKRYNFAGFLLNNGAKNVLL